LILHFGNLGWRELIALDVDNSGGDDKAISSTFYLDVSHLPGPGHDFIRKYHFDIHLPVELPTRSTVVRIKGMALITSNR
jgi:hypothetical protein